MKNISFLWIITITSITFLRYLVLYLHGDVLMRGLSGGGGGAEEGGGGGMNTAYE